MNIVAKVYGMNVRAGKMKLVIKGEHIGLLLKHLRDYAPNIVFTDETLENHVERATRIIKGC